MHNSKIFVTIFVFFLFYFLFLNFLASINNSQKSNKKKSTIKLSTELKRKLNSYKRKLDKIEKKEMEMNSRISEITIIKRKIADSLTITNLASMIILLSSIGFSVIMVFIALSLGQIFLAVAAPIIFMLIALSVLTMLKSSEELNRKKRLLKLIQLIQSSFSNTKSVEVAFQSTLQYYQENSLEFISLERFLSDTKNIGLTLELSLKNFAKFWGNNPFLLQYCNTLLRVVKNSADFRQSLDNIPEEFNFSIRSDQDFISAQWLGTALISTLGFLALLKTVFNMNILFVTEDVARQYAIVYRNGLILLFVPVFINFINNFERNEKNWVRINKENGGN